MSDEKTMTAKDVREWLPDGETPNPFPFDWRHWWDVATHAGYPDRFREIAALRALAQTRKENAELRKALDSKQRVLDCDREYGKRQRAAFEKARDMYEDERTAREVAERSAEDMRIECDELRKESATLCAAIGTPEVYAGIITEVLEAELDQTRKELTDGRRRAHEEYRIQNDAIVKLQDDLAKLRAEANDSFRAVYECEVLSPGSLDKLKANYAELAKGKEETNVVPATKAPDA